jgi:hypothetical protein
MGASTTRRREPGRAGLGVLVGALGAWLASGCGSAVSLDDRLPEASGSSSTTAAASTEAPPSAVDTVDVPPPDLPIGDVPPLPPPEVCPAECTVELPLVWTWESEPLPARRPPDDPPDLPDGGAGAPERRLAGMVRALDGSFVVGENLGTEPWLTRVDRDGALVWSTYFDLVCDCALVELALTPEGNLMVAGEGAFGGGNLTYLSVLSASVGPSGAIPYWLALDVLWGSFERPGRAGSLLPLGGDAAAVLVVETGLDGDELEKDWFEVYYYVSGAQEGAWLLDTQLATTPPRRPRGVPLPRGELTTTLPGGAGLGDYVAWVAPWSSFVTAIEPLPGPVDAMVAGPDAAIVAAGVERAADAPPLLRVAGLPHEEPPAWIHAVELPAGTSGAPALAAGADGSAYVALRVADEQSDEPAVSLLRLHPDGSPAWSTSVPLPASDSPTPVALSLADDGDDLVLAAVVDGRIHLERREQGCRCD